MLFLMPFVYYASSSGTHILVFNFPYSPDTLKDITISLLGNMDNYAAALNSLKFKQILENSLFFIPHFASACTLSVTVSTLNEKGDSHCLRELLHELIVIIL